MQPSFRHTLTTTFSPPPIVLGGVLLLFAAVVSLLLPSVASAMPALTYSCNSPHCYGKVSIWSNAGQGVSSYQYTGFSEFTGTQSNFNVVSLTIPSSGTDANAKINEETWLVDDNETNFTSLTSPYHQCLMNDNSSIGTPNSYSTFSICWTESGYQKTNLSNSGHEVWFQSYVLPLDGLVPGTTVAHCGSTTPSWDQEGPCTYHNVFGPQLNGFDTGTIGAVQVAYDNVTAHQMDTIAQSGDTTNGTNLVAGIAAADYAVPDLVQFGAELGGTTGVNGPKVHFTNNIYQTVVGSTTWSYHTIDGLVENDNPPLAGWVSGHDPLNSTTGGSFEECVFANCTL